MKVLSKPLLLLLLCLITTVTFAQQSAPGKPKLFARFPDKINITDNILSNAFGSSKGQAVSIVLGNGLVFSGTVITNEFKYVDYQNITIKSPGFDNAFLSISRITHRDNSITYTGRILNARAGDGYEIKKDEAGNYRLQKFETGRILQDCSF